MIPENAKAHDIFVVLPEFQVVICLTPKVASTSIVQTITEHYGAKIERPYHKNSIFTWFTLKQVQTYVPNYKRIMFVRNPFDRLVGCYEYHVNSMKLQMSGNMRSLGFRADMTFDEFLLTVFKDVQADPHYAIQSWQTDRVDFLGKFESIEKDWGQMCSELDLPFKELKHTNKTARGSYRGYFSEHWRTRAERVYSIDLKTFRYKF